jgi:hypothetical protein
MLQVKRWIPYSNLLDWANAREPASCSALALSPGTGRQPIWCDQLRPPLQMHTEQGQWEVAKHPMRPATDVFLLMMVLGDRRGGRGGTTARDKHRGGGNVRGVCQRDYEGSRKVV